MEIAPFGKRLLALFADWALSYFVAVFLARLDLGGVAGLQYLVFFVEVTVFTSLLKGSVGQRLMNLKVVTYPDGDFLPIGRAFLRTVLILLVIPVLFTSGGRGYHDVLANSIVTTA